ncbi:hypothetical protein DPMN_058052 [Dreissena polymorpha]|uniref:Uncharacterized protein n=1 Tax=Dreissena polymorpha TaxID=45954 RepID=A0A9D4C1A8_DREPO|nr:hypothetical protein DPMN_058052 [Dreissena polymorpha]
MPEDNVDNAGNSLENKNGIPVPVFAGSVGGLLVVIVIGVVIVVVNNRQRKII